MILLNNFQGGSLLFVRFSEPLFPIFLFFLRRLQLMTSRSMPLALRRPFESTSLECAQNEGRRSWRIVISRLIRFVANCERFQIHRNFI